MEPEQINAIKIAVIEEQILGLREQAKAHASTTKEQFSKVMEKLEEISAEVAEIKTSAKVGWKTVVAIGSTVVAIVGLAISYFRG